MNSCFIVFNSFLSWFSCCSWRKIIVIIDTQQLHHSSHFWVITLLHFIMETKPVREIPHWPATHLPIFIRIPMLLSGKGNPFTLHSGPHTLGLLTHFGQAIMHLTLVVHFKGSILSFLLSHRQAKLILFSGLCTLSYLSLKVSSLR